MKWVNMASHTCKGIDTNSGTHLLKVTPELRVLPNVILVLPSKLFQVFAKCVQLTADLGRCVGYVYVCVCMRACVCV